MEIVEIKFGEHGDKIQNKNSLSGFCYFNFERSRKNQIAYLILQVAYLVGKSVNIFWLACNGLLKSVQAMTQ